MSDNKAVMQMALEALGLYLMAGHGNSTDFTKQGVAYDKAIEGIAALSDAIAQPEQQTDLQQQNQQLREQNTALDLRCAEYERTAQTNLQALVHKVHAAKGRHHTQIAMCDLYDACGLTNVRPSADSPQPKAKT